METTVTVEMVEDTEVTAPILVVTEILDPILAGTEISDPILVGTEVSADQMADHSIMVAMDWFKLSENLLILSLSLSHDKICFTSRYEIKTFIYSIWLILFFVEMGF